MVFDKDFVELAVFVELEREVGLCGAEIADAVEDFGTCAHGEVAQGVAGAEGIFVVCGGLHEVGVGNGDSLRFVSVELVGEKRGNARRYAEMYVEFCPRREIDEQVANPQAEAYMLNVGVEEHVVVVLQFSGQIPGAHITLVRRAFFDENIVVRNRDVYLLHYARQRNIKSVVVGIESGI